MRAGTLRHRVTLQRRGDTRDGIGTVTETWTNEATVWASIEPLQGREYFEAQRENADVTHKLRIRHRSGVTREMRVIFEDRVFDIEAVLNVEERDRELVLMCKEEL